VRGINGKEGGIELFNRIKKRMQSAKVEKVPFCILMKIHIRKKSPINPNSYKNAPKYESIEVEPVPQLKNPR
tara:strand:- start:21 stop:236 length:216 start_codon:yes stop_codon:yes gene_type:complete